MEKDYTHFAYLCSPCFKIMLHGIISMKTINMKKVYRTILKTIDRRVKSTQDKL